MSAPHLTADLPGIGGVLKQSPEDFVVEEVPAYEPCGEGEHLFLWVEKRDLSAEQLHARIARVLGIARGDVGIAGLKDRRAVTRQFVSVPAKAAARVPELDAPELRVLSAALHRNKLRTGHLRGNRFEIIVRDVAEGAFADATAIAAVTRDRGFPNYYGEQRFGVDNETAALGFDLLTGRRTPRDIPPARRRFLLRLALSAAQSLLFNEVLANRIRAGRLHRVEAGDVMQVVASRGCFVVADAAAEQARFDRRETVVTGPMFGIDMKPPTGAPLREEQSVLEQHGVTSELLAAHRKLIPGARRPCVIWPEDLHVEAAGDALRFRFILPSGVYATTLLREFLKPTAASDEDDDDNITSAAD
ncbi:MAG: tRNA pseudouridine(13) synthase TruD [Planctomycetaceae bacterium]|nr:tRNA pseudouridine(13) synthase TruD [Planctomycetaceae bacterium]